MSAEREIFSYYSVDRKENSSLTYSMPDILPFSAASFQTRLMPPTLIVPIIITANCPANMTNVWNTSVQITALSPPYKEKESAVNKGSKMKIVRIWNPHSTEAGSPSRTNSKELVLGWYKGGNRPIPFSSRDYSPVQYRGYRLCLWSALKPRCQNWSLQPRKNCQGRA